MKFPAVRLLPKSGEIYAHIFENLQTRLNRNLFWAVTVEFEPLEYGGDTFDCLMTCEWIQWSIRRWTDLDGRHLEARYGDHGIESSFYMGTHHLGKQTSISLVRRHANLFGLDMAMNVEFGGYFGGDENPTMRIQAQLVVPYSGLIIIPDNLSPRPDTVAAVRQTAAEFVDLSVYAEPVIHNHGYLLRPTGD